MNLPKYLLRLSRSNDGFAENPRFILPATVQWGAPIFHAPMLPTPNQLSWELPFSENFRPKFGRSEKR